MSLAEEIRITAKVHLLKFHRPLHKTDEGVVQQTPENIQIPKLYIMIADFYALIAGDGETPRPQESGFKKIFVRNTLPMINIPRSMVYSGFSSFLKGLEMKVLTLYHLNADYNKLCSIP